jgi:tetratricopeptide (TPR) repeat protein
LPVNLATDKRVVPKPAPSLGKPDLGPELSTPGERESGPAPPAMSGAQGDDLAEAQRLNGESLVYYATGRYQQAIALEERAITIYERVLGEHPSTASSLNNLGALYQATGAYPKAETLYQRALAIREKALGPEHPDTSGSLNDLAALYEATGAFAKAEPLYQRALAIREKALGPEHPDTAKSLDNLAGLYEATGAYAKAPDSRRRAAADSPEAASAAIRVMSFLPNSSNNPGARCQYHRTGSMFPW